MLRFEFLCWHEWRSGGFKMACVWKWFAYVS